MGQILITGPDRLKLLERSTVGSTESTLFLTQRKIQKRYQWMLSHNVPQLKSRHHRWLYRNHSPSIINSQNRSQWSQQVHCHETFERIGREGKTHDQGLIVRRQWIDRCSRPQESWSLEGCVHWCRFQSNSFHVVFQKQIWWWWVCYHQVWVYRWGWLRNCRKWTSNC